MSLSGQGLQELLPPSREHLRSCARCLAGGVSIVTTCDIAGRPHGLTMSAVTCLSLDPALFLICVGETADTLPALLERRAFAVNILRREQETLARVFAGKGGAGKFHKIACIAGVLPGVPVIADALAVVECELVAVHPGGDHRILIGDVRAVHASAGDPLLYYAGDYRSLDSVDAAMGRRHFEARAMARGCVGS